VRERGSVPWWCVSAFQAGFGRMLVCRPRVAGTDAAAVCARVCVLFAFEGVAVVAFYGQMV